MKRTATKAYFEKKIAECKADTAALKAEDRLDEAAFAAIRTNVYDIFNTVFHAAEKTAGNDDAEVLRFFLTKLEQIPGNWQASLENAEKFGDSKKAHIERIKLDTAAEIRNVFEQIWEDTL